MCADLWAKPARQRGVTLIELLVSLVIAMLVVLAAFGASVSVSAAQRQAVSASATSAALNSTLAAIKAEVSATSLGFTVGGVSRCLRWSLDEGGIAVADNAPFLPFSITRAAAGHTDRLDVVLSTDVKSAAMVRLAVPLMPGSASVGLRGWLPAQAGQRILIAPHTPGAACTVREVTAAIDGTPFILQLTPATFSEPLGGYEPGDTVAVLGRIDRRRLEVDDQQRLVMTSSLLGGAPSVLADNVVAWRAQYGVADASGGVAWKNPVDAWASLSDANVPKVRALRLGIVARSPQRDKGCEATTDLPKLFGERIDVSVADPDGWRCHRYRRAEVVIPLRNVAWGAT